MQQKGRTEQILERLQEMINNGQGALAPGKVSLPKEELSRLILELSMTMETELKQYREITDKRAKVLREAKKQADDIIYEAEQSASRIRVSGRKTAVAPIRMMDLEESERRSLDNANEIYAASLIYTDEMMAEMQDIIEDAYEKINESYEHAVRELKEKSEIIAANRKELMEDLKGMEKEDRYQQIMEIGQLLSEELYYARKRAMGEEDTGSVQEEAVSGLAQTEAVPVTEQEVKTEETAQVSDMPAKKQEETAGSLNQPDDAAAKEPAAKPEQPPQTDKEALEQQPEEEQEKEPIVPIITMDPEMQRDVAATVANALEEKKKVEVEVSEITEEVSEAVKKDPQPSLSTSVIEAMKRAAKKAVMGMEEEDDMLFGEPDEEDEEEAFARDFSSHRIPTQPLDTKAVNERLAGAASVNSAVMPMTPEQIKEEKHRAFVEAHQEKVRAEEEKWLNAVYDPVIPDVNAVDPIVAMVLQEKQEAKKQNASHDEY